MLLIIIAHESGMLCVTATEKRLLFFEAELMSTESMLKEQLVRKLARLPEERLHEVLHFVESLLRQEQQTRVETLLQERHPAQGPLLQYSGGVAHGSLARNIDQELYGT
jgi:hypothetical protein